MDILRLIPLARKAGVGLGYDSPLKAPLKGDRADFSQVYIVQDWVYDQVTEQFESSIESDASQRIYFPKHTIFEDIVAAVFGAKSVKTIISLADQIEDRWHEYMIMQNLHTYSLRVLDGADLSTVSVWPNVVEAIEKDLDGGDLAYYLWKRGYSIDLAQRKLVKEERRKVIVVLFDGSHLDADWDSDDVRSAYDQLATADSIKADLSEVEFIRPEFANSWVGYFRDECESYTYHIFPAIYADALVAHTDMTLEGWL